MLERELHQGASLLHHAPDTELRVAGLAPVPDALGLESLWHTCAHLQNMGYPVVVLDGCSHESTLRPGLAQVLDQDPWSQTPGHEGFTNASTFAVLPAAHGLQRLAHHAHVDAPVGLSALQQYFHAYALVLIHAPVEWLGPLLQPHAGKPLVMVGSGTTGTQQAYQQIEHLALHMAHAIQVCAVVRGHSESLAARRARAQITTLQRCAVDLLGRPAAGSVVNAENAQDLQRLALQLLENAGTISSAIAAPLLPRGAPASTDFVRSH
jgi:uncharacterized protein YjeT (DUF2065 family)